MKIKGLQKLTLLDFPGKTACTVFLAGCNFRCPFCHNASLVTKIDDEYIEEETFFSFLQKRQGILQGVCITGGEPTLAGDLPLFIKKIKDMGFAVKLDTNGSNPQMLQHLVEEGLVDYVAMDIKNSLAKYGRTVGLDDFDTAPVQKSVAFLLSNKVPYEFRTTVVRELHTVEDIQDIVVWLDGAQKYYLQGFEDSGDLIGENFSKWDQNTMEKMEKVAKNRITTAKIRGL